MEEHPQPLRRTVETTAVIHGRGLTTGRQITVRLQPYQDGIVFHRLDTGQQVRLGPENARLGFSWSCVGDGDAQVAVVEHFLACIAAAGITDLLVEVDGPELPFGDGSAMLWEMALPGTRPFGEPIEPVVVSEPVFLHDIDRGQFLVALPADAATWRMTYILDWAHPLVGTQVARFTWAQDSFRDELAAARTFALEEDAKRAKSEGLFPGGTEDSLVLVRPGEVSPDPGRPDAFARHKLMDLMGDLYLMGRPVRGIFAGYNSGHRLNHQLVARLSAQNA